MRFSSFIFFFLFPVFISAQPINKSHKILFYNVENLFDTINDSLTNDDEFTPRGERYWTIKKLSNKINKIAKTVLAIGEWNPPDIIGLCEIENSSVLEKLIDHPLLKHLNYRYIQKESPDHRGIDVALLYRKDIFIPKTYHCIPIIEKGDTLKTREILHVTGKLDGGHLHLFVNHWPSRYGGLMETTPLRKLAAQNLKNAINIVLQENKNAKIICMGDFNDQPWDSSISVTFGAIEKPLNENSNEMINLSWQWKDQNIGTLKHQQNWNIFDQFIVNNKMATHIDSCYIFQAKFLLEADNKFTGYKPFRTYNGYKYHGGFSDHLPIVLVLKGN